MLRQYPLPSMHELSMPCMFASSPLYLIDMTRSATELYEKYLEQK